MLKKEWQAIFKHKFFIIVIIALSLVPAIYNYVFLGSMWDPYGNLKNLPVAVVNLDKASELNGQKLQLGDSVITQMKKSKDLDYHFVSQEAAANGLKKGDYYMVITFPEQFSENAASLMTNNPKSVQLDYQTSRGHNYISSKMSESAMDKLQAQISEDITKNYTTAIFDKLSDMKSGMKTAADGSQKLSDGTSSALTGSDQLTSNLQKLSASSLTFTNGADDLKVGVSQYVSGVAQAKSGADQLVTGTQQFTAGTAQLANGTQTLNDKAQQLSAGLSELTESTTLSADQKAQIAQLQQGLSALNSAIQSGAVNTTTATAVQKDLTNVQTILQGQLVQDQAAAVMQTPAFQSLSAADQQQIIGAISQTAQKDLAPIQADLTDVGAQLTNIQNQMKTLAQQSNIALPAAANTISTLSNGMNSVNTALTTQLTPGFNQFTAGVNQVNSGAQTLAQQSKTLAAGQSQLASGLDKLQQNSAALTSGTDQLSDGAKQISSGADQLANGSQTLNNGLTTLDSGSHNLSSALTSSAKTLSATNSNSTNADKIAAPLTVNHTDHDNVPVNGEGMTPYMVCVALFIGALATNVVIGTGFSGNKWKTGREFMLAKIGTNGVIALLQALIVFGAVSALGLRPNYGGRMLLAIILISFAFMAINTFFLTWLGKVGEFIMIVFLVLQLATSAGTYPLQLSARIFQVISPLLPMTYGLRMLRQTIGLSGQILPYVIAFAVIIILFTAGLSIFKKSSRFA